MVFPTVLPLFVVGTMVKIYRVCRKCSHRNVQTFYQKYLWIGKDYMRAEWDFADDIDGLAGEEEELANLGQCLDKASTAYSMEITSKNTKLMTNNTSGINSEIQVNGQKFETVTSFKYLGSVIIDEGSKPEILSRTAQTTAALTKLKPIWNDRSISLSSKIWLMHTLVTSIFLYACESWTLTEKLQRKIQTMEIRCCHKILHTSYKNQQGSPCQDPAGN